MRSRSLFIVLSLLAVILVSSAAIALTVVVNGKPLPPDPPALQRGGRVLLPMRVVFESLGATVKWHAATQTAIGIRGNTTVRMSINRKTAYINDQPVVLDVPPQLINGFTYMPVRFPAEAFGAEVGWNGATQTVTIALETPSEPFKPQPGMMTGVISDARENQLVLTVDSVMQLFSIGPDTIILRENKQIRATDLHRGELAAVQHDGTTNALIVRASHETVKGVVRAKVPNQILIDSRAEPLVIQSYVEVTTTAGEKARYADLKNGDTVVLRLTPGTNKVFGIIIDKEAGPTQPPTGPPAARIDRFYHDAEKPLKAGDTLRVTLEGTIGGTAWFDIGDLRKRILLGESRQRPGRHEKYYEIEKGLNAQGVPLIGYLQFQGKTVTAQSAVPVTIDTTAPEVNTFGPGQGERATNRQPNMAVSITDEDSSGVDFERSTISLRVNGQDHPAKITRQGSLLMVVPEPLPPGSVQVLVRAYDKAGNETKREWNFSVASPGAGEEVFSVSHDAAGVVLVAGNLLTVTATGPAGGQASFDLGKWQRGLPLKEDAKKPGTYQGTFTVPRIGEDRDETLEAHLQTKDGRRLDVKSTMVAQFGPARQLAPILVSPTANAKVGEEVIVEGDTQPFSQVTVKITWRGQVFTILQQTGQVTETQVTADRHGHFKTQPISLRVEHLLPVKEVRYTLACVAKNPKGEEAPPVTVEFTK